MYIPSGLWAHDIIKSANIVSFAFEVALVISVTKFYDSFLNKAKNAEFLGS